MLPKLVTQIPGPRSRELAKELARSESQNITYLASDFPVFWKRAAGCNVWDADGNRYLDFTSAFGVAGLGHGPKEIVSALKKQAADLPHAMGDVHPTENKVRLCQQLSAITFERWSPGAKAKTILTNSGSEAVEAALKTALIVTGKPGVLSFEGAYHGLGHGALTVSGLDYFRSPFRSQLARFGTQVSFPDTDNLEAILSEIEVMLTKKKIGAVLVEPIQGRAGERVPPSDFLSRLRCICNQHQVLLILDEIYTGFNRTGSLFACEHSGVIPDLICLGKGLSSLFPIAACVGLQKHMDAWPESTGEALHTSTFLGNPMGCAAALESIRLHLRPETQKAAQASAEILRASLAEISSPAIAEIRGAGLLIGIQLKNQPQITASELAARFVPYALQHGLLILASGPAGDVISLCPPFFMSEKELRFPAKLLQEYLTSRLGSVS